MFDKNLDFWQKFGFLTKIWIFDKNLDFWQTFVFFTKKWIFDKHLYFSQKMVFLTDCLIWKFGFFIFEQIFHLRQTFRFWTSKLPILTKKSIFDEKIRLFNKNFDHWLIFLFWQRFVNLTGILLNLVKMVNKISEYFESKCHNYYLLTRYHNVGAQ